MRVLHPVRAQEALLDAGTLVRPDGAVETWQVHRLPADRTAVRVEADGPALWHLVLDPDGRPERLQARLRDDGRTFEATLTFFEDEVIIWRRGAEPATESIALPPGTRLLWPPLAGRERCLAGLVGEAAGEAGGETAGETAAGDGAAARMFLLVRRGPPAGGGLSAHLAKLTIHPTPDGLTLTSPGLTDMALTLDADGRLAGWSEGGPATVRRP
ncbi:MAG: hypothetical protein IT332_09540 [Ardenticatenales bacterium]|nr:hypothetical protein [Ardenticatenales bacterium]